MKILSLIVVILISTVSVIESSSIPVSNEWRKVKSPLESARFEKLMSELYPPISSRVNRYSRIFGGELARLGQFQYHALLEAIDNVGERFICGGAIISFNWILTAAHCLEGIVRLQVYVGVIDRINGPAVWDLEITNRADMIMHENYLHDTLLNDIAVVRLVSTITTNPNVNYVSLPKRSEVNTILDNKLGTVAGFGRYLDTSGPSPVLRWAQMNILPNSVCESTFGKNAVRSTNVCLDGKGRSTCSGDSGGALTTDLNGRKVVVGVVSFGAAAGCSLSYPTVFTRVASYLDWIEQKTKIQIL